MYRQRKPSLPGLLLRNEFLGLSCAIADPNRRRRLHFKRCSYKPSQKILHLRDNTRDVFYTGLRKPCWALSTFHAKNLTSYVFQQTAYSIASSSPQVACWMSNTHPSSYLKLKIKMDGFSGCLPESGRGEKKNLNGTARVGDDGCAGFYCYYSYPCDLGNGDVIPTLVQREGRFLSEAPREGLPPSPLSPWNFSVPLSAGRSPVRCFACARKQFRVWKEQFHRQSSCRLQTTTCCCQSFRCRPFLNVETFSTVSMCCWCVPSFESFVLHYMTRTQQHVRPTEIYAEHVTLTNIYLLGTKATHPPCICDSRSEQLCTIRAWSLTPTIDRTRSSTVRSSSFH